MLLHLLNGDDGFCLSALITLLHLQTVTEAAAESEKEPGWSTKLALRRGLTQVPCNVAEIAQVEHKERLDFQLYSCVSVPACSGVSIRPLSRDTGRLWFRAMKEEDGLPIPIFLPWCLHAEAFEG